MCKSNWIISPTKRNHKTSFKPLPILSAWVLGIWRSIPRSTWESTGTSWSTSPMPTAPPKHYSLCVISWGVVWHWQGTLWIPMINTTKLPAFVIAAEASVLCALGSRNTASWNTTMVSIFPLIKNNMFFFILLLNAALNEFWRKKWYT